MSKVLIVLNRSEDWAPYYPSDQVISVDDYLSLSQQREQRVRVINICSDYSYLSEGYYCSLLSEARAHKVIPSSRVINELSSPLLYGIQLGSASTILGRIKFDGGGDQELLVKSCFGQVQDPNFRSLARLLFERFPCPILEIRLRHTSQWEITELKLGSHLDLNDEEQTFFAEALERFSNRVWKDSQNNRNLRYDMAILVNPDDPMPPSDEVAIRKFIKAARDEDINAEVIGPDSIFRLAEFDALFIRETTSVNHHTYRFAKRAESEGLVVIDDSQSIVRCANKIYLANVFQVNRVPTPRCLILHRDHPERLEEAAQELGLPIVIKIPDGSFSRGVKKVETLEELRTAAAELFQESSLVLAQEYLYTSFDWRIGILNNRPLYACRYHMVKKHWQIYRHGESRSVSGGFDTLPTFEVPKPILQAALAASRPIGDGLYGVDLKEVNGKGYVIEVNDNPNVDSGVEDKFLGKELYAQIMQEFKRRLELQ
ncbi:MAG: RimK family protein [Gammaproteobacteria bacterium]|nr:RimK family protein [Pseudomonadales bacterium]MCP5348926.1 RimK family protein [Pseudomonadales bacterium]